MKSALIILCAALLTLGKTHEEDTSPGLFFSQPNYILGGFTDKENVAGSLKLTQSNQVKININVNYRIIGLVNRTGFYLGYTQKSFWNFFDYSAPFFDNNYQPELYFFLDNRTVVSDMQTARWVPSLKLALNHHSNGMVDLRDRSWDRAIVGLQFGRNGEAGTMLSLSMWLPLMTGEMNEDIARYAGIGSVEIMHTEKSGSVLHWAANLDTRYRLENASITSVELSLFYNPFHKSESVLRQLPPLMLQAYLGRAETLLSYKRLTRAVRIGFAFM